MKNILILLTISSLTFLIQAQPGARSTFIKTFVDQKGVKIENVETLVTRYNFCDSSKGIYKSSYSFSGFLYLSIYKEQRVVFKQKGNYMIIDFKNTNKIGSVHGIPLSYVDTVQFIKGYFIVDFEKVLFNSRNKTGKSYKEMGVNINPDTQKLYRQKGYLWKRLGLLRRCNIE